MLHRHTARGIKTKGMGRTFQQYPFVPKRYSALLPKVVGGADPHRYSVAAVFRVRADAHRPPLLLARFALLAIAEIGDVERVQRILTSARDCEAAASSQNDARNSTPIVRG